MCSYHTYSKRIHNSSKSYQFFRFRTWVSGRPSFFFFFGKNATIKIMFFIFRCRVRWNASFLANILHRHFVWYIRTYARKRLDVGMSVPLHIKYRTRERKRGVRSLEEPTFSSYYFSSNLLVPTRPSFFSPLLYINNRNSDPGGGVYSCRARQ